MPYHRDPNFVADVPERGTLFPFVGGPDVYRCPDDDPGAALDTPDGGGGNGRLSYSLNAFVGYQAPESLTSFRYVADVLDRELPGDDRRVSFRAGQVVRFRPGEFKLMFEDHPFYHTNRDYPDGSFNGIDRLATRHGLSTDPGGRTVGRTTIGFLDGHVEAPRYPAKTLGRQAFAEFGQPALWLASGRDEANSKAFIRRLAGRCPWGRTP